MDTDKMNLRTPPNEAHAYTRTTIYNQPQEGYNVQPKVHVCMYTRYESTHEARACNL